MDVQVEKSDDLTRVFTVTVPADNVRSKIDDNLQQIRRTHRQRGFRPGKVPMAIIRKRFGRNVTSQVVENLIRSTLSEVLSSDAAEGVVHVSAPELLSQDAASDGLAYRFNAETLPDVDPSNYMKIEVERPTVEVNDDDLEQALQELVVEHTFDEPVEKTAVEAGDVVHYDAECLAENTPPVIQQLMGHHKSLLVPAEDATGLAAKLVGLEVGKATEVEIEAGEDTVAVQVTVAHILERNVPELDDELAKDDGRAETLDELKEILRNELNEKANARADDDMKQLLARKLVEFNPFDLPQGFLDARVDEEIQRTFQQIGGGQLDIRSLGLDMTSMRDSMRPGVEQSIKQGLLLEAIADKEEVEVSDEDVDERINETVEQQANARNRDAVRRHYLNTANRDRLRQMMLLEKTMDTIAESSKIKEVSPEEFGALLNPPAESTEDDDAEPAESETPSASSEVEEADVDDDAESDETANDVEES